jgi:GNAT superfamily N-acetyltransferase
MKSNTAADYSYDLPEIRQACLADIPALMRLNGGWQVSDLEHGDLKNGFLFGGTFTRSDFEKIIAEDEIVVLAVNGEVVGYYLLDNCSDTELRGQYIRKLSELERRGALPAGRISQRAQAAIHPDYHHQGYSHELFEYLLGRAGPKYDYLFSVISKKNPKIAGYLKAGWEVVSEEPDLIYVVYRVHGRAAAAA